MKKDFIYKAGSVDEAIKNGLADLSLTEEKVKIEVLDGGSSGFLGLFKKEAKVKLIPLDYDFEKIEKTVVEEVKQKNIKKDEVSERKNVAKAADLEENDIQKEIATEEKTDVAQLEDKKEKREDYIVKNKDSIVKYLKNIVIAMGYKDADVEFIEEGNRHFTLNIKTEENTSLIIGKRGNTLNSLQFLVNNYAKKFSSHFFRIEVDCDDYRETRKKTLEELALNLAKKSKKIGKPVELEPMTSVERKIMHNALTGIKNVETESCGEEPHRYLVITAK
ncbi:RNA-binding cell elongation regulator Jag/EloR [Gemella cuniculi]|uniref:RNA-binding cell elongation regulator Jag/EloR n=1 Tax=Gemella cuniculi TaxID=150240 RepID=UPI0004222B36|nr:RNA-binding cell elongation regulator Jag/EloR [Gemella cuniculi]